MNLISPSPRRGRILSRVKEISLAVSGSEIIIHV